MHPYTPKMMTLFQGNNAAHGEWHLDGKVRDDGKITGSGITVKTPVTVELWDRHISGKDQLGIIPINESSECKFGAIDVDDYTISLDEINTKIRKANLPLILFRSKSGGAHLYLFTKDYLPASEFQDKLKEYAAYLGLGDAEIFPKQTRIISERGDVGQWINMPYFNAVETKRYAINQDNEPLTLEEFFEYLPSKIAEVEVVDEKDVKIDQTYNDGPPCLQYMHTLGIPAGTRNVVMFNFGNYLKRKYPDDWKAELEKLNRSIENPLPAGEFLTVMKSVGSKDYAGYQCKTEPLCSFCNSKACKKMKYGIGGGNAENSLPELGALTKVETEPPLWFLDVEDGRIELTTDDLQSPRRFQKACMDALSIMPPVPKNDTWQKVVARLMQELHVVEIPREATPTGQLEQMFVDFCTLRASDDDPECLTRGLIYNANGLHHFRIHDFTNFLDRNKFFHFKQNKIISHLKEMGCHTKSITVKGRSMKVYFIPEFYKEPKHNVPNQLKDTDVPY